MLCCTADTQHTVSLVSGQGTLVLHGLVGLSVALCHGRLHNITSAARGCWLMGCVYLTDVVADPR